MPNHKRAWLNLLILLDETGNCAEVLSIANEVLEYHSSEASILSQLGICCGKLGQYGSAEKFMLEAVQLDKTNAVYWNNIGESFRLYILLFENFHFTATMRTFGGRNNEMDIVTWRDVLI